MSITQLVRIIIAAGRRPGRWVRRGIAHRRARAANLLPLQPEIRQTGQGLEAHPINIGIPEDRIAPTHLSHPILEDADNRRNQGQKVKIAGWVVVGGVAVYAILHYIAKAKGAEENFLDLSSVGSSDNEIPVHEVNDVVLDATGSSLGSSDDITLVEEVDHLLYMVRKYFHIQIDKTTLGMTLVSGASVVICPFWINQVERNWLKKAETHPDPKVRQRAANSARVLAEVNEQIQNCPFVD